MEEYCGREKGKDYTRIETSLNSSECSTRESEKPQLPNWVKVIDFYLTKHDKENQEAGK